MEIITGIATLAALAAEPLKAVSKHVIYPFKVSANISSLESATRRLRALKSDVETMITNSERGNGVPTVEINLWLAEVESFEQNAANIHHQQCRCLWNISPNPWSNYKISRRAAEKRLKVESLCDRRAAIREVIMPMPPPLAHEIPVSSSKSPNLESALSDIKNGSQSIIGIWGMGGVGKTHLLKQINNELSRDGGFKVVVFVTCSKECSAEKVQKEIIKKLGLTESDSGEIRQITIHNFLKKNRFVLLLDDLWSKVDLETVGIPTVNEADDNCKSKVVITTRSKNVCALMNVDELMKVDVLDWSAAWILFKRKSNEKIIESNLLVRKYAVEVVKELGGLPLALVTVGSALSVATDPNEWKHAAELLKQARLPEVEHPETETDENVFKQLKFSYDRLRNDKLRKCFLLCSLYPEDYAIPKWTLLHLWVGLGYIDEDDMRVAYDVGYKYIRELQAACLLEETDRESNVKLHDVIRDMSLWIARKQGTEKNKWILLSHIAPNHSEEIVIHEETELISVHNLEGESYFSHTGCGAKITFLSICWVRFPPTLLHFSRLTGLEMKGNQLTIVPKEICNIITLQFLDLSNNKIKSLPAELAALVNLRCLMLRGNRIGNVAVGAISNMRYLKVLDLRPDSQWTRLDGEFAFVPILLRELQSLHELSALGIEIYDEVHLSRESALWNVPLRWPSVSIRKQLPTFSFSPCFFSQSRTDVVSIGIQHMVLERLIIECPCGYPSSCQLKFLDTLLISHVTVKEIIWRGIEPNTLFPHLKRVFFWDCKELTSISWVVHLPSLQELDLKACSQIKQLVIASEINVLTLLSLTLLHLNELPELECICDPEIDFPALEYLQVIDCCKLKKLPFRTEKIPPKLKRILSIPEEWWKNIEWEDSSLKSSLSGFVRFHF